MNKNFIFLLLGLLIISPIFSASPYKPMWNYAMKSSSESYNYWDKALDLYNGVIDDLHDSSWNDLDSAYSSKRRLKSFIPKLKDARREFENARWCIQEAYNGMTHCVNGSRGDGSGNYNKAKNNLREYENNLKNIKEHTKGNENLIDNIYDYISEIEDYIDESSK